MQDRLISGTVALAIVLWVIGFAGICFELITERCGVGELGATVCMVAGLLHVRHFFTQQNARETNAFQLGRDSVTSIGGGRRDR